MGTKQRELITRKEYAERKGVAPRTIGKYTQSKVIPLHGRFIDPVEADACLADVLTEPLGSGNNKTNTGKKKPAPEVIGDSSGTFVAARTREKQIKVELLEIELLVKQKIYVAAKDVEVAAYTAARQIRDRMLNIPDKISAIVAAERDEIRVRAIIIGQIEKELDSLVEEGGQQ